MRTKVVIGEPEKTEVRVKEYEGGGMVVDSGDSTTEIKGKKLIAEKTIKVTEKEKEELLDKPDKFILSKGRLVRRDKKQ
jgi:hypothetical protein